MCGGRMPLRYHMHCRKAKKTNFGSVAFCCVVYLYTHYLLGVLYGQWPVSKQVCRQPATFWIWNGQKYWPQWSTLIRGLTGQSVPKLSWQRLVCQSWPHFGGRMPLRYHMHYRKAQKNNFGSVTFCCVVYVYTHYYWVFWYGQGPASRQVCRQPE